MDCRDIEDVSALLLLLSWTDAVGGLVTWLEFLSPVRSSLLKSSTS